MPTTVKETSLLVQTLQNPSTTEHSAVDSIVEYILARRRKSGWALYDVTLSLIEVMQKVPHHLDESFDLARTRCFLPHHTDLTPPSSTSSSPQIIVRTKSTNKNQLAVVQTLMGFLAGGVGLGQVREVLAEWTVGLEFKLAEGEGIVDGETGGAGGGSGGSSGVGGNHQTLASGGKGSIGSLGFDQLVHNYLALNLLLPKPLDPGLSAVLLSVRLSLGYLTFRELQTQLTTFLGLREGEECLKIWVGRRLQGDGRWAMGNMLDELIKSTEKQRPALKGIVRMVRRKYLLPLDHVPLEKRIKVPLPAPGKQRVIASLLAQRQSTNDLDTMRNHVFELCSEYLTREKRESMRAEKWSKVGRRQLSRDLDEIEDRASAAPGPAWISSVGDDTSTGLLPTFDVLRRIYVLDPSTSKISTTAAIHFQPITIPDENEAYLPPTVQTITSALYVEPRLTTDQAVVHVMELVDYEKDLRMMDVRGAMTVEDEAAEVERTRTSEDTVWGALVWGPLEKGKMRRVLESIERRFPGGEYDETFEIVRSKVNQGTDLARAPSYTTVASLGTAQRTDSYLRGSSHARGSTSMSTPPVPPLAYTSSRVEEPPLMEILETEPVSSRTRYHRTNTTPNERIPGMLGQAMRKMSLSNRELSSIINSTGSSPAGSPSRSSRAEEQPSPMVHSNSQNSVGTESTIEDIYAGYGDSVRPMRDERELHNDDNNLPPLQSTVSQVHNLTWPQVQAEPPAKTKRKASILRRPGFLGGSSKSDKVANENSILNRSGTRHRSSESASNSSSRSAAVAAIMSGTSTPSRKVGDTSASSDPSSATSSPSGWRAEFNNMNNGMGILRPAPKHAPSSSLGNSPSPRPR